MFIIRGKQMKGNKAITLVALIITIVILLVLATVSISLVMNDGIIDRANKGVNKYSEGEIEEQIKLAYQEYQMHKYSDSTQQTLLEFIHSKLDELYGENNVEIKGVDTLIIKMTNGDKKMAFQLSSDGNTMQVTWVQDKTNVTNIKTGQILEVGDTVYYDSGVTEYEGEGDNQGKWGILGVENGKILIASKENIGTITLSGKQDYLADGKVKLNNACTPFINTTYADSARSIELEDINKIKKIGILETLHLYTMTSDGYVKLDNGDPSTWSKSFTNLNGEKLSKDNSISVIDNYHPNFIMMTSTSETKAWNLLKDNSNKYWFNNQCSRCGGNCAYWGYYAIFNGYLDNNEIFSSFNSNSNKEAGVRAVVSLKENVKLSGDSTNGWTID